MSIVQRVIAALIERVFGHYVTTVIGVLVVLSATLGGMAKAISENLVLHGIHVQSGLITVAAVALGVAGILAKDAKIKLPTQVGMLLMVLFLCTSAQAQSSSSTEAAPIQNLYGAGVSYSVNATPAIAGTALYCRALNSGLDGTYGCSMVDALPNTVKPFTVSTNIGAGIAQKAFTLGNVPVYVPTAAGISWSGGNTGWEWNGGAFASIHVKSRYYLMPSVRFLKSSVGGSGYQPIIGLLLGRGN